MNQLNSHLIKEHRESLLARQFILLIKKGHWPQGTTVPAVHKLAKSFSASSVTVCKALALLHQEGAISRNSGERRFLVGKENPDLPEQLVTESFQYSWKSVVEDLKLKVLTGHYGQGSSIPSMKTLRNEYSVSHRTLKRAIEWLAASGILRRRGSQWESSIGQRNFSSIPKVFFISDNQALDAGNLGTLQIVHSLQSSLALLNRGVLHFKLGIDNKEGFSMPRLGERDGCVFYIRRTHPWYKSVLYSKHLFASVAIDQTDNDSIQTSGKYVTLIKLDNIMAGRTVAKHLHDLGHRRIAFLSFCEFSPSELIGRRFAGVREFFPETDPDSNFSCQLFDRLPKWWKPLPPEKRNDKLPSPFDLPLAMDRVTAWICISDVMALNAIQVLRARGIGVPRRLSIISFNNSPICHSEGLTTYDLNHFQTGHLAAASLIHRPTTPYGLEKCLRIQGALVIRSTTGFPLQSKI